MLVKRFVLCFCDYSLILGVDREECTSGFFWISAPHTHVFAYIHIRILLLISKRICVCADGSSVQAKFFQRWLPEQRRGQLVRFSEWVSSANSVILPCSTGWRKPRGCLKLQVIFRKRATNYRALLRKMTCNLRHPMSFRHPVHISPLRNPDSYTIRFLFSGTVTGIKNKACVYSQMEKPQDLRSHMAVANGYKPLRDMSVTNLTKVLNRSPRVNFPVNIIFSNLLLQESILFKSRARLLAFYRE